MSTVRTTSPQSPDTLLNDTELASLVNANTSFTLGPEIDNTALRYPEAVFDLELGSINTSASTSPGIEVYCLIANSAGTYGQTAKEGNYVCTIPIAVGTGAETKSIYGKRSMVLGPYKYKFFVVNATGQTLNATGNSLKFRRSSVESV